MKQISMSSESFYSDLSPIDRFVDISDPSLFSPLPDDWSIAVSDVKNSTEVIKRGGYKEVNLIGASTIIALLNLKKSFSIPFIFGGDGASICIPDSWTEPAKESLLATRNMARDLYGIDLRVGLVPVRFVREHGYDVLVARTRLSETFAQAAFTGGGLQFAEECLKDHETAKRFALESGSTRPAADFSGLECRWQNVPSVHGEIVTLIVQALGKSDAAKSGVYKEVIGRIGSIYGDDAKSHPLQEQLLTMTLSEKQLKGESGIRSYSKGRLYRIKYWFSIRWNVILGAVLMRLKYKAGTIDWGGYRKRVIANTDFKKFDDKLRQVLSGSADQRDLLTTFLEEKYKEKKLVYGMHVASNALITCLIFNYTDDHVHLIDSDDGGYAMAAIQLKERLAQIQQ